MVCGETIRPTDAANTLQQSVIELLNHGKHQAQETGQVMQHEPPNLSGHTPPH